MAAKIRTGRAAIVDTTDGAIAVEWRIDTRVTLSTIDGPSREWPRVPRGDPKTVRVLRRSRNLLTIFLFAISVAVVWSHLRREVRSLQAQVHRLNVEVLLLTREHEELKGELRRERLARAVAIPSSTLEEEGEEKGEGEGDEDEEEDEEKEDASGLLSQNPLSRENVPVERTKRGDDPSESRSGRVRRDEGRGKKRRKHGRNPKRGQGRLGPLVATFVGGIPEQHVTDTVYVGPWVKSAIEDSRYSLDKFHLVENRKSVEVTAGGLYMISVQIFYFGEPKNYSYWILVTSEGASHAQKLAKCATASADSAAEVSCYTSVITLLRKGDRLHVQQQERDRLINMREGHSYMQLALLSNGVRKKF